MHKVSLTGLGGGEATLLSIPRFPEDEDLSLDARDGLTGFALSMPLRYFKKPDQAAGWWLGWSRCYGQGVKASILASALGRVPSTRMISAGQKVLWKGGATTGPVRAMVTTSSFTEIWQAMHDAGQIETNDADCPYPQFSGPWEAWAEGHDAEHAL